MAIDLNMEIKSPFSSDKKKQVYPTKTTMNLAMHEKRIIDGRKAIIYGIIALIVLILLLKFAVFDQFAQINTARASYETAQASVDQIEQKLANYDAVAAEYSRYSNGSTAGSTSASISDILNLIDKNIAPSATVSSVSLDKGVLTVGLTGTTLDTAASIVSGLNNQSIVSAVSVYTATNASSGSDSVSATLVITLKGATSSSSSSTSTGTGK